jgi:hypothetical protein
MSAAALRGHAWFGVDRSAACCDIPAGPSSCGLSLYRAKPVFG